MNLERRIMRRPDTSAQSETAAKAFKKTLPFVGVRMRKDNELQSIKERLLEIRRETEALGYELLPYFIDMAILELKKQEEEPDTRDVDGGARVPRRAKS